MERFLISQNLQHESAPTGRRYEQVDRIAFVGIHTHTPEKDGTSVLPHLESDPELVRSAQSGDMTGLAVLLERHRAGMLAVALSLLGYGPDAEDAVQDAMLVAMRRIDEVRDPAAIGPWLRTVVRNNCRMRLRTSRPVPLGDLEWLGLPTREPTPDELLEHHARRDWVWHALSELSEPVRLVTMLRYFSDVSSYEQIAALCGVPVGTVRSRLNQGRSKLATALRATADAAHDDVAALNGARRREAEETLEAAQRGEFERVVREAWWPDLEAILPWGQRVDDGSGRDLLLRGMDKDLSQGVRQRITNVLASGDVMIWEADLISPPDDPEHCPPGVIWLQHLREGRVRQLRLFHPRAAQPQA
ncbi:RNA polymerase sigma factor [Nonomuraea sp. M3C6]|uniref:RNA polymerase sigma factor n=1 Tax=Nonomuraea marmarensis TaxID=3351344 RepID=A0ABW7ASN8_9ACTN